MDGFAGSKTAASEELPTATAVTDPFHVVRLAGNALDQCRRRIQDALFAGDDHVEVEATWHIYQQMIAAYHESDPTTSKTRMESLNAKLTHAVPACLTEVATLGRTPNRRRADLRFLRPPRHQQRPHQSTQRPPRTPPRLRTRLPQPHPPHHPNTPRDQRLQTSPTPSNVKSQNEALAEIRMKLLKNSIPLLATAGRGSPIGPSRSFPCPSTKQPTRQGSSTGSVPTGETPAQNALEDCYK